MKEELMGRRVFLPPVVTLLALVLNAGAILPQEDEGPNQQAAPRKDKGRIAKVMSAYAEPGVGVVDYKTDDRGRIRQVIVVGDARVSTVLGRPKGPCGY